MFEFHMIDRARHQTSMLGVIFLPNIVYDLVDIRYVTIDTDITSNESRKKKRWWSFESSH